MTQQNEQVARAGGERCSCGDSVLHPGGGSCPRCDEYEPTIQVRIGGFLREVEEEVARARAKFPGNAHQYAALAEEVGEVARALLEGSDNLREECVQVAAMAMRLAEEGDGDFG